MEPRAFLYGLPYVLYERHGVRRYGFHGTSHRFVSCRLAELVGRLDDPSLRSITCHLGNGCSVAAIRGGRSVDTSMGFTPLEGLVMGSRSGDLDPAILLHVAGKKDLGLAELNALLNKHSGLLGISGLSNRARSLDGLSVMGLSVDSGRNEAVRGREAEISPEGSGCRVFVVPTNEELLIARDTFSIVRGLPLQ